MTQNGSPGKASPQAHPPPPYLRHCGDMDFDEALRFMEDTLAAWSGGEFPPYAPRSELELYGLLRVLIEKGGLSDYDGYASPLKQSLKQAREKLAAREAKLERLEKHMEEAFGQPSTKKRDVWQMKQSRERLEREVDALYVEVSELQDKCSIEPSAPEDTKARIISEIRRRIERVLSSADSTRKGRLQWRILPAGQATSAQIYGLYDGSGNGGCSSREFDPERLNKAFELQPNAYYTGANGFDGYIIFTFPHTSKALMECPYTGNAIFVIASEWEHWSRMTKQELREDDTGTVVRIEHRADWFEKVKEELEWRDDNRASSA